MVGEREFEAVFRHDSLFGVAPRTMHEHIDGTLSQVGDGRVDRAATAKIELDQRNAAIARGFPNRPSSFLAAYGIVRMIFFSAEQDGLRPQIGQRQRRFIPDSHVRSRDETATTVEIDVEIDGVEGDGMPLEAEAIEGQEGRRVERRPKRVHCGSQKRGRRTLLFDTLCSLVERCVDIVRRSVIPGGGRNILKAQFAPRCKDEDSAELPRIPQNRRLSRSTSKSADRIPDQLR